MSTEIKCLPYTAEEIRGHRVRHLRRLVLRAALICTLISFAFLSPLAGSLFLFVAAILSVVFLLSNELSLVDLYRLDKPLRLEEMERLFSLSQRHSAINTMLQLVKESGRPVALCDLYRANDWLFEQEAERLGKVREWFYGENL